LHTIPLYVYKAAKTADKNDTEYHRYFILKTGYIPLHLHCPRQHRVVVESGTPKSQTIYHINQNHSQNSTRSTSVQTMTVVMCNQN